jgi:hypothetical protein
MLPSDLILALSAVVVAWLAGRLAARARIAPAVLLFMCRVGLELDLGVLRRQAPRVGPGLATQARRTGGDLKHNG